MQQSLSRVLCGMGMLLIFLLASITAHAEMPEWVSKGQFLVSGGLNLAKIETTAYDEYGGSSTSDSGTDIGITLEGAYNYPLTTSWSVEGGLMHWGVVDVGGTGLTASVFYQMKDGRMLGAGVIPDGVRFIARQHFDQSSNDEKSTGLYGQITINGFSGNLDNSGYSSVIWTALSVGYAF